MLSIVKKDMVSNDASVAVKGRRRRARDLIAAVLENMRGNLEPLKYSTLAPSRYVVYVHPAEFARIEGIVPILQEETVRALAEELERLNSPSPLRRYGGRFFRDATPRVQAPAGQWQVEFVPDPDGDMAEGDILIDSELLLPAQPEIGAGERTRRITTSVHEGQRSTTRQEGATEHTRATVVPRAFARLVYEDSSGRHSYDVTKDLVTIGRGGNGYHVDVRIASSVDVSREHARIRRDGATGRFFLVDVSTLGTTLNNRHVPRAFEDVNGVRRDTGAETPLPDRARIGLAETVFLDFTLVPE